MKATKKQKEKVVRVPTGDKRVIGVDPSSNALAFSVMDRVGKKSKLIVAGKINLPDGHINDKFLFIGKIVPLMITMYKPDRLVIEQSIYIQNAQTMRILAGINGHIMGKALESNIDVEDVPPMTWKSWLGYKRIMKFEKDKYIKEMGKKEANKFMNFERKERTRRIVIKKLPEAEIIKDHDVIDAVAISMWAAEVT